MLGFAIGDPSDLSIGYTSSQIDYHWNVYSSSSQSKVFVGSSSVVTHSVGSHAADDEYMITYDGSNVKWYYNGTQVHSVARSVGSPLFVNSTLYDQNTIPTDVEFGPLVSEGETTGNRLTPAQGQSAVMGPQFVVIPGYATIATNAGDRALFPNSITLPDNANYSKILIRWHASARSSLGNNSGNRPAGTVNGTWGYASGKWGVKITDSSNNVTYLEDDSELASLQSYGSNVSSDIWEGNMAGTKIELYHKNSSSSNAGEQNYGYTLSVQAFY